MSLSEWLEDFIEGFEEPAELQQEGDRPACDKDATVWKGLVQDLAETLPSTPTLRSQRSGSGGLDTDTPPPVTRLHFTTYNTAEFYRRTRVCTNTHGPIDDQIIGLLRENEYPMRAYRQLVRRHPGHKILAAHSSGRILGVFIYTIMPFGSDNLLLVSACATERHSDFNTVGTALIDALLDLIDNNMSSKPRLIIPATNRNKQHWATLFATRITAFNTYAIGWCGPAQLPHQVLGCISDVLPVEVLSRIRFDRNITDNFIFYPRDSTTPNATYMLDRVHTEYKRFLIDLNCYKYAGYGYDDYSSGRGRFLFTYRHADGMLITIEPRNIDTTHQLSQALRTKRGTLNRKTPRRPQRPASSHPYAQQKAARSPRKPSVTFDHIYDPLEPTVDTNRLPNESRRIRRGWAHD